MRRETVKNISAMAAEPSWILELRLAAFDKMDSLPLPVIERVKYHRWNLMVDDTRERDALGHVPDFTALDNHPKLIQVGTQTVLEQLPAHLADAGVVFTDLNSALELIPDLVGQYFCQAVSPEADRLAAYNTAYFNSAAVLYVPDNVEVDLPIEGVFYQDGSNDMPFIKRVLIIAGKNSKFTYLERFETLNPSTKSVTANIVVEVIAQAGSQIKFAAIDRLGEQVTAYVRRRGYHLEDAQIDWAMGVLNEGQVITDFDSDLIGAGSHADLKVVGMSSGRQIQGIDTRVTNHGKHSTGHILQHGVILERGTLTFNGIGHILQGAKGADAQQESRVLMLSDSARSDANPILLIDENEVTAGHAASVGQVDPEDMYYLMSRGLDRATAERLVVRGFLGTVLTEIPIQTVREEMIRVIEVKLQKR